MFAERLHLFLASGLAPVNTAHERAEVIEIHWIPLDEACEWALNGAISDCKTVIGLLRARNWVGCRRCTPGGNNP